EPRELDRRLVHVGDALFRRRDPRRLRPRDDARPVERQDVDARRGAACRGPAPAPRRGVHEEQLLRSGEPRLRPEDPDHPVPVSLPSTVDHIGWIERDSEAFAVSLATTPLDARVPGCPDWSLADLAWHLGNVQRFWARIVRVGADVQPEFPDEQAPPDALDVAWMRDSTAALLD